MRRPCSYPRSKIVEFLPKLSGVRLLDVTRQQVAFSYGKCRTKAIETARTL